MIDVDALIQAIKESTRIIDVCVPSQDYYSSGNDWQRDTIHYIEARDLVEALEKMKNE